MNAARGLANVTAALFLFSLSDPAAAQTGSLPQEETPPPAPLDTNRPQRTTVFLKGIHQAGSDEALARNLTLLVEQTFQGRGDHEVLSAQDLTGVANADAAKAVVGCDDAQCVADLSRFLNADLVVTGDLGKVGRDWSLTLVLINSRTATVHNRVGVAAPGAKQLFAAVPAAVVSLMRWDPQALAAGYSLPKGKTVSLAVLDLTGTGVTNQTAANLTQVLSTELKRIDGTSVVSRADILAMMQLQEQKMLAGCDDASCLAEIGGALGVEQLVAGNVGKVGDTFIIALRLINVKTVRVEHRVFESFLGGEEQLIRATRHAGRKILGVEEEDGTLTVSASQQGAQLFLDGKLLGVTPLPPVPDIAAGAHTLHVAKPGFREHHADVYVEPGEANPVWVPLEVIPVPPWYQRPWLMTSILVPALVAPPAAALVVGLVGMVAVGLVYALVVRDGVTPTSLGSVEM